MTEDARNPRTIDLGKTKLNKDCGAELVFEKTGPVLRLYNGYDSTDTDINALVELMMTIPELSAIVEKAVKVHSKGCPIRDVYCQEHGFIHGKEAEELRKGIEKLIADCGDDTPIVAHDLQRLLDTVDARDSLAWLDASDREPAEPRHAHVEGVCVPVCGEEESYLQFFPKEHGAQSITSIVNKAEAEPIPWRLANALETPNEPHYSAMVDQYRTESGRSYPTLYRLRVHVFVEDVSTEEAEKLWKEFDRFEQGDDA